MKGTDPEMGFFMKVTKVCIKALYFLTCASSIFRHVKGPNQFVLVLKSCGLNKV